MPVYRYQASAPFDLATLQQHVPGTPTLGAVGPLAFVDVTLSNSAYKADLDGFMAAQGYAYVSTTPTDTPLDASQLLSRPMVFVPLGAEAPTPAANNVTLYNDYWGRQMITQMRDDGSDYPLQPGLNDVGVIIVNAGTGAAPSVLGGIAFTTAGTITHPALASTNLLTQSRRFSITSATGNNSSMAYRGNNTICWRGNVPGQGGFHFACHFAVPGQATNGRAFVGLINSLATQNANPSSLALDIVGMGFDAGDANMQLFCGASGSTASKVDLGANFAKSLTDCYELFLHCDNNDTSIKYLVENRVNGATASGMFTTNLPANNAFLTPHIYGNNGGSAGNVAEQIDVSNLYIESDI